MSILFFLLLLSFAIVDFRKAFIIYMSIFVWLASIHFPFGSSKSLFDALSFCLFLLSFIFIKYDWHKIATFPLRYSFVLIAFSLLISGVWGKDMQLSGTMIRIIVLLWNVLIFWYIIEEKPLQYLDCFIKSSLFFSILFASYALFEVITNSNPLVQIFNEVGLYKNAHIIDEIRFGIKRCQSFLTMHTTAGGVAATLFCFLFYLKSLRKNIPLFIIILLPCVCLFSGARSAIAALCTILFAFSHCFKVKRFYFVLLCIALCFIIFRSYITDIYQSFLDTRSVNGSNTVMRMKQLNISLLALKQSYWIGNGLGYVWSDVLAKNRELYGAESLWFPVMIDQGALGIVSYLMFFIECIIFSFRSKEKMMIFFVIGILILFTLSSIPKYNVTYSFIYLYAMLKYKQTYNILEQLLFITRQNLYDINKDLITKS